MSRFVLSPLFAKGQWDWSFDLNPFAAVDAPVIPDAGPGVRWVAPASNAAAPTPTTEPMAVEPVCDDPAAIGPALGADTGATPESGGQTLADLSADVTDMNLVGDMETEEPWAAALASAAATTTPTTIATAAATTTTKLLTSYTSGAAGAYNITINFQGSWTAPLQQVFVGAADRISKMIVGDLPNVTVSGLGIVDDIVLTARLAAIDGVGGILGSAGPTALRSAGYLPATAQMQFDSADATAYNSMGLFDEIVTHEMLHSVGIGTIWGLKGLTSGMSFIGKNTVAAYNKLVDEYKASHGGSLKLANGTVLRKDLVPLETTGGSGTAGSHWSEAVFDSELMTGWIDAKSTVGGAVPDPLSTMTLAALKDLGYTTAASAPTDFYKIV